LISVNPYNMERVEEKEEEEEGEGEDCENNNDLLHII
jgi:hypothetical protein